MGLGMGFYSEAREGKRSKDQKVKGNAYGGQYARTNKAFEWLCSTPLPVKRGEREGITYTELTQFISCFDEG